MSDQSKGSVQVIARAARILDVLSVRTNGCSLGEIAAETGLARSTVQRIVNALQDESYVVSFGTKGGLRLGPGISRLAKVANENTAELCTRTLMELSAATGETADLSVLRNDKMVFVAQVPGTQRLITLSAVGEVFPLTTTANGRSALATLPRRLALDLAKREMDARRIRWDAPAFAALLDAVERSSIAHDREEHSEGVTAVGFGFRNWNDDIYSISVPAPTARFERNRTEIETALLDARESVIAIFSQPAADG